MNPLMDLYLEMNRGTEPPVIFHRWALLSAMSALLGRNLRFKGGHLEIYPNTYVLFVGIPATRKSTAIKIIRTHLADAGFEKFGPDRTTKEKFLMDLAGIDEDLDVAKGKKSASEIADALLSANLWGSAGTLTPSEAYIAASEFTEFFGNDIAAFCRTLGDIWDSKPVHRDRIKNGKSVEIHEPTVSILGGITPSQFALSFPPELIGQGFLSRLLLVFSDPTGTKETFPRDPDPKIREEFLARLRGISNRNRADIGFTPEALSAIDYIYKYQKPVIDDVRFEHFQNRRFDHLMKLILIVATMKGEQSASVDTVIEANTYLAYTEMFMPKALGQFGKAKNSAVVHKVLSYLHNSDRAMTMLEIWQIVHSDVDNIKTLVEIITGLRSANKIQDVLENGRPAFLPIRKSLNIQEKYIDFNYLTAQERGSML